MVIPGNNPETEKTDLDNITNLTGLAWKGNNKMQVHYDATYDVTFTTHDLNGTEVSGKALQFNSGYGYLMPSQLDNDDYWYSLMQFIAEDDNNIIFNNALGVQYGSWTSNDSDYTLTSELNTQEETSSQTNPTTTGGTAGGSAGGKTSATISLAEARGRIDTCIDSATTMQSTVAGLSASDQKQFTADVIKAINDMPASIEEKTAKLITSSIAALRGASDGNVATILAEVFACADPASLPVVVELFASTMFDPSADPNVTYTDTQLATIATNTLATVAERCNETDNGSVRTTFAAIMFDLSTNRLSGTSLVNGILTEDAYELATEVWIPDAVQGSYESILASADAGKRADKDYTLILVGTVYRDLGWSMLSSKNTDQMSFIGGTSPVLDAVDNPLIHQNPVIGGEAPSGENPRPTPDEPEPYPGQGLPSSMINETAWYKLTVYPSGLEGSEKCDGYIYFTGGEDATNSELIAWLNANGTFSIPNAE